jgi:hypothetical protein
MSGAALMSGKRRTKQTGCSAVLWSNGSRTVGSSDENQEFALSSGCCTTPEVGTAEASMLIPGPVRAAA